MLNKLQPKDLVKKGSKYLFFGMSALLLLVAAIYNGFPLVYSDTSTYLASGFELETPIDRPITYGLFLRLTSLNGSSLWLTVFLQSAILVFLIRTLLFVLKVSKPDLITLFLCFVCALTTGVSWTASQLIADIFTPALILIWAIICLDQEMTRKRMILYGALLFCVSSMHMSHFIMSSVFSVLLLVLRFNKRIKQSVSLSKIGLVFISSALSFVVFASSYSKFKHVFFVAKMNESKLLKKILDEQCGNYQFKLCAFKDSLPQSSNEFMWEPNSPMQKLGGYSAVKPEFNKIISIAISNKNYLGDIVVSSAKESYDQLIRYEIADGNGIFMNGTKLYVRINKYVPGEINAYSNSRQQKGILFKPETVNIFFSVCMVIALLLIAFIFKRGTFTIKLTGFILFAGILINAIICGSFAPVSDRFGCRVVWLIVFFAGLSFASLRYVPENNLNNEEM